MKVKTGKCSPRTDTICALPPRSSVLLKLNGTSAQWCVGTCVPILRACRSVLLLRTLSHGYLENCTFSLLQCIRRYVQHWMWVIMVLVLRESMHFCVNMRQKPFSYFATSDLWTLTLWSKTCSASCSSCGWPLAKVWTLYGVLFSTWRLALDKQTDGQTDRRV